MKVVLVLCLFVACASAWTYTREKCEYDFAIPKNVVWNLNEKQSELHGQLVGYSNLMFAFNPYRDVDPFDNTHVTCTALDYTCGAGRPHSDAALSVSTTEARTTADEFAVDLDEHITLKFVSPRPFTTFERALFGRQFSAMRDTAVWCTVTSWTCAVDEPSDDYEGFSVGYATSNATQPDIVLLRALTFEQAHVLDVGADQYGAAIRATFADQIPQELENVVSTVHSCRTFSLCELFGVNVIPNIHPSDEISRGACAKVNPHRAAFIEQ